MIKGKFLIKDSKALDCDLALFSFINERADKAKFEW